MIFAQKYFFPIFWWGQVPFSAPRLQRLCIW